MHVPKATATSFIRNPPHRVTNSQSPSEFEKLPKAIESRRFFVSYTPEPARHKVPAVSPDRAERKSYTPHLVTPVKPSVPTPKFNSVEDEKPIEYLEPKKGEIGVLHDCKLVTFSDPPYSSPQPNAPQTTKKHQQQYHEEKEDGNKKPIVPEEVEIDFVPSPPPHFVKGPMEIEKPSEFIEPEIRNTNAFHTFEQVMFSATPQEDMTEMPLKSTETEKDENDNQFNEKSTFCEPKKEDSDESRTLYYGQNELKTGDISIDCVKEKLNDAIEKNNYVILEAKNDFVVLRIDLKTGK